MNELKPIPVKVTVEAGAPAINAADEVRLDAVMIGARAPASPMPRAPVAVYEAPLPGAVFVIVTLHCTPEVAVLATVTGRTAVDALVTESVP